MNRALEVCSMALRMFVQRMLPLRTPLLVSALLGATLPSVGCEPLPPATAVAVSVKIEADVLEQLAEVNFRVFKLEGEGRSGKLVAKFDTPVQDLLRPFIVTRGDEDQFLLSVEGTSRAGDVAAIVHREVVTFVEGETLALPVYLASVCYEKRCPFPGQTCYGSAYGAIAAGACEKYPMRQLVPVEKAGEESAWVPVPTHGTLMDAGFRPVNPSAGEDEDDYFDDEDDRSRVPRFDGGLSAPSCSGLSAGRSCLPGASGLDASIPPLLGRQ